HRFSIFLYNTSTKHALLQGLIVGRKSPNFNRSSCSIFRFRCKTCGRRFGCVLSSLSAGSRAIVVEYNKLHFSGVLSRCVCFYLQLAEGLKVALDTTFVPNTGKKSGKLKTSYKREYVNLGCNIDVDLSGPTIYGWAVLGYEGWLAGYQMAFDTAKSKLSQNNFALGYKAGDFQLHTNVNDGTEFGGSIYQKVNNKVETSVNLAWTAGSNNTRFGIAAKYQLDEKTSIVAKVNNASLIGIGYTHALRPGVKLTLSGLIDGKNFSAGGHKVGLGFELEA
uniref:Non-selective voltage-gated ion channel VDAC3 n=1 Tax=Strix occidentalis caurina TaxID=311401 RepID=A0A8D0EVQ7_STROC